MEIVDPWLVAVWPGMGGVAQIAGHYLVRKLGAEPVAELPTGDWYDVRSIHVKEGLAQPVTPGKSRLLGWRNPSGHDLLVYLGEQQPQHHGYRFCQELLRVAAQYGVDEVYTFAALATPIHPQADPRVFAVATRREQIDGLKRENVHFLKEAEISGLNGVLVAAAAEARLPGTCLLGEFPYFAQQVPNPKASAAVLRTFTKHAGIELDFTELDAEAERVEKGLTDMLERLQGVAETLTGRPGFGGAGEGEEESPPEPKRDELEPEDRARVEALFEQARQDRAKAVELKAELDRLGVFKRFEDRFLDLFKHGG